MTIQFGIRNWNSPLPHWFFFLFAFIILRYPREWSSKLYFQWCSRKYYQEIYSASCWMTSAAHASPFTKQILMYLYKLTNWTPLCIIIPYLWGRWRNYGRTYIKFFKHNACAFYFTVCIEQGYLSGRFFRLYPLLKKVFWWIKNYQFPFMGRKEVANN